MQSARLRSTCERQTGTLRVLAVSSIFPNPAQPSHGIFNAQGLEHLSSLASVRVISPVRWFPALDWALQSERRLRTVPQREDYHGLPVSHPRVFRTPGFARAWHGWFYRHSVAGHFREACEEFKPEVLLAICAYPDGYAVQQLGQQLGIPVVVKCMGSDVHQLLKEQRRGRQVLATLQACSRVITVSAELKQRLVGRGIDPAKIEVVYNGVDRTVFKPLPRTEARHALKLPAYGKIVLCVANLLPVKRHADLLQAFHYLLHRHQIEARLVLVGDGPCRMALERQALRLQIAGQVRFMGSCRHEHIPLWMNASDAVCLASANEGLPNVLYEALACGRPVVATAVGGIPELLDNPAYGRLIEPGQPLALANALCEVLWRAWDPAALSACPRIHTWPEAASRLLDVLQQAASNRPATLP